MDTTDILIKIRRIVRSINLESKKVQKQYGVSIPQVLCMNYLLNSKSFQASQGEIRNFLNLNSSTVSGIINRLEAKGLVARLPKAGDKRVTIITLTSKGHKLMVSFPPLLHDQLAEKLNTLPENSLIKIEESLDILIDILSIRDEDKSTQSFPFLSVDDFPEDDTSSSATEID